MCGYTIYQVIVHVGEGEEKDEIDVPRRKEGMV
jgi:hypothetical protein